MMRSTNPYSGEVIGEYPALSANDMQQALSRAAAAQKPWRQRSRRARAAALSQLGTTLSRERDALSALMTAEMGKPIAQAKSEIDKCIRLCEVFAEYAEAWLEDVRRDSGKVRHAPRGVILAIMPWNFPFWQALRCIVPALAAGNGVVLKHADHVQGCGQAIERCCREAGLPEGLVVNAAIDHELAASVIDDPRISAVTLTGSRRAGIAVAQAAAKTLTPCILELGGSDAYVVLDDADVELAAKCCAESRLINSGQSCIAAKRFIVMHTAYPGFLDALTNILQQKRVGNPMAEDTDVGPLARADLAEKVRTQLATTLSCGGQLRLQRGESDGNFVPISLITEVSHDSPAAADEIFGPVAAVFPVATEDESIALANASVYGLGGAVFSRDVERAERAAERMETGAVAVNDFVRSDPHLPFGGVKASGYGRELGREGLLALTNVQAWQYGRGT